MKDPLCKPHHLGGSLKEGEEKPRASKELLVGVDFFMSRCCCKDSEEGMEEKYFMGDFETIKEEVAKTKKR